MPGFVIARLSVAAPVILAAALFAIPADEARAHNDYSATLHAETYPLHEAAKAGDLNSVNHFITVHMADVDAKDNYLGSTPLHYAVSYGNASVVSILIAAGADVNAKSNGGDTPLRHAVLRGHASVVSILIAAGADVNAKSNGGDTPLRHAAQQGHASVVSILIAAGAEVNADDAVGNTPLHSAAQYGHASVVSILIAAGAEVNVKNIYGNTPLRYAAQQGHASVVSILIAALPGVNAYVCRQGYLYFDSEAGECVPRVKCHDTATRNPDTNECECTRSSARYLQSGVFCTNSCGNEAERADLRYANHIRFGFYYYKCECPTTTSTDVNGVCEFLYPCHDSAIRKADNSGCECPAGTFAHGDPSGGARYRSRSYNYKNKIYTYYDQDDYGRYEYIPDTAECHSASDGDHAPWTHDLEWTTAVTLDGPEVVSHFIADHGRDPDANHDLYYAAEHGYYQAAKALIEGGANPDQKNGDAGPPLHPAVRNERAELITLLINRGANVNLAADDDGETPLHLAARRADTPENAALVSFLLDKGADPNIFNDRRWRPLDLADGRDGYPRRRKIMSALIAGGANWSDECVGGKVPNEFTPPKCKCPARLSIDNNGLCECPAHSHSQVNGLCLPKDSAQVEGEIAKMQVELARLRAALVSLNARLSFSAEMPREMVEDIAEQARETAAEIDWRRANFVALGRRAEAGEAPPPVALSDTAAECRMRGGEVRIDSRSGTRICLGLDQSGTFCLVDSGDVFSCRGLFKHVRVCNDVYHRPALNAFICAARCDVDETARGKGCE